MNGRKGKKNICAKGQRVESRDNLASPQYASSWTWRKIEDNGVGYEELLVAKSYKRCRKICGRL